jgi:hypothetical protein
VRLWSIDKVESMTVVSVVVTMGMVIVTKIVIINEFVLYIQPQNRLKRLPGNGGSTAE